MRSGKVPAWPSARRQRWQRGLSPCVGAADDAVVRPIDDLVWQAAPSRQVARDVLVKCRVFLQVATNRCMRIKHYDIATTESADVVDWRNEIGITGNYNKGICTIFVKVHHHGSREVDI